MTEANAAELVNWLNDSQMVGEWRLAENFRGAVIEEAMALNPDHIPDGWKIGQIAGQKVHIMEA